ncbi:acetolactate decarboxylase [Thiohalocapsa marina]|uniref:Alpha-acetolactate decarboxylase n=1 Tax=Thiohalocapsa marina TaxID=424902 RepID=A0A5M8FRU7_9GAMM|nr:acetolactate decarboxylase [Thiohalocapsa marina]KAA6185785.1 acetolactate decarboxylase [Thiohalocapsa marina]
MQETGPLPPELLQQLQRRARASGQSVDACLQQALRQYLKPTTGNHALYVSAPVNALIEGIYQENTRIGDILAHGDFGLGTFNDLDGEMLVLDGVVYQMRADGHTYPVDADTRTPYTCVCFFSADSTEQVREPIDSFADLQALLARLLPSANMIYAIRIEGAFDAIRFRSVPRQDSYRPLVEVAREQPEFELQQVRGVLAGFWTPDFMGSLTVPGYHLHFIDAEHRTGGHLLDCRARELKISLQHLASLQVGLPITLDYLTADFTRDLGADLQEAEH